MQNWGGTTRLMSYTPQCGEDGAETVYEEAQIEFDRNIQRRYRTMLNKINNMLSVATENRNSPNKWLVSWQYQPDGYATLETPLYRKPKLFIRRRISPLLFGMTTG